MGGPFGAIKKFEEKMKIEQSQRAEKLEASLEWLFISC